VSAALAVRVFGVQLKAAAPKEFRVKNVYADFGLIDVIRVYKVSGGAL
jgi:hypothetical protein